MEMYEPVRQLLIQQSSDSQPFTIFDVVEQVKSLTKNQAGAALSNLYRHDPYIHREKIPNQQWGLNGFNGQKRTIWGYWYNPRYTSLPDRTKALRSRINSRLKTPAPAPAAPLRVPSWASLADKGEVRQDCTNRRVDMINGFHKVGYSTGLVVTSRINGPLAIGDRYNVQIVAGTEGRVVVMLRRSVTGYAVYPIKTRPHEVRVSKTRVGRHVVPAFMAQPPEAVYQVQGGWDLVIGADRRPPKRNNKAFYKARAARGLPAPVAATPAAQVPQYRPPTSPVKLNSLREAVRIVNAHKDEFGAELVLSIDANGRLLAMVEYS